MVPQAPGVAAPMGGSLNFSSVPAPMVMAPQAQVVTLPMGGSTNFLTVPAPAVTAPQVLVMGGSMNFSSVPAPPGTGPMGTLPQVPFPGGIIQTPMPVSQVPPYATTAPFPEAVPTQVISGGDIQMPAVESQPFAGDRIRIPASFAPAAAFAQGLPAARILQAGPQLARQPLLAPARLARPTD